MFLPAEQTSKPSSCFTFACFVWKLVQKGEEEKANKGCKLTLDKVCPVEATWTKKANFTELESLIELV